ncbi:MAG: methyltransferase domain-containing protein [Gammaproteobacteria bacterium]|jgi:SAM-dependent methyltransferase|nr:methyltransferase domain-containing protein [Gammaproteobacteria bacterium]
MSTETDLQTAYRHLAAQYDANRDQFDLSGLLDRLQERMPEQGLLLDLGCGAGVPVAQTFLASGWEVVGVDFCPAMLALAAQHVPAMRRICGDMRRLELAPNRFDAVTFVYSLFHVPWSEHDALFQRIARWLRPNGRLFFTYATADYTGEPEFEGWIDFMGERLFYSHSTEARLRQQLTAAGLQIEAEERPEIGGERFLWVTASAAEG